MRVEHDLDLPFGTVIEGAERWVFVGYATNTVGSEAVFVREMQPHERVGIGHPYHYFCAYTETVLRKFPALERFRR